MKNPLVITASVAVLIALAALATLGVLSALAAQRSGLDKSGLQHKRCAALSAKAARDVTDPDYGARLARLASCHAK